MMLHGEGATSAITVCCMVHRRASTVAAALALFRPVASELAVAVDARVDVSELGPLLAVADQVHRFEHRPPSERALPWLLSLARFPHIFLLEGDEVPSAMLLRELPAIASDRSVWQAQVARRWCFPDGSTWLDERPWWPDLRVRYVWRDRPFDVDVIASGGIRERRPARVVTAPLYQLTCLLEPFAERRQRARELHAWRGGLVARGGGSLHDILHVPEHFATRRPVAVPEEDAEALAAVLGAPPTMSAAPAVPIASADEVASHLPAPPDDGMIRDARLRLVELDPRTDPGNDSMLAVEVANGGTRSIPHHDEGDVQVRVHTTVIDRRPGVPVAPIGSTPLLGDIPPGAARIVEAVVRVPSYAARYTVEARLVNERGAAESPVCRFQLDVVSRFGRYDM